MKIKTYLYPFIGLDAVTQHIDFSFLYLIFAIRQLPSDRSSSWTLCLGMNRTYLNLVQAVYEIAFSNFVYVYLPGHFG